MGGTSAPDDDFFSRGSSSDYSGDNDLNWDNMFDDEDLGLSDSHGGSVPDSAGTTFDSDFEDDFSDDFSDDFADDTSNAAPDTSRNEDVTHAGDELSDDFSDDFEDDFDDMSSDDFDDFSSESDSAPEDNESGDNEANDNQSAGSSSGKLPTAKMIVVLVAIVFAIGLLFFVKLSHMPSDEDYTSYGKGNHDISSSDAVESEEPVSSQDQSQQVSSVEEASSSEAVEYRELKYAENSEDVKKMQLRLCELGYIGENSCTGYYGDYTVKMLKKFQKAAGLKQTGKADVETLKRLYADDAPRRK